VTLAVVVCALAGATPLAAAGHYFAAPSSLDPALADVMLQLAARNGNDARFRQLVSRLRNPRNLDEQHRYLDALAGFDRADLQV
jgi:hypothetical protein